MPCYWHSHSPHYAIRSGLQGSLPLVGMTIRSVFRERGKTKGSGTEKLPYGLNHLSRSLLFSLAPLYRKSIVISTVKTKRQLWLGRRDLSPAPYALDFLDERLGGRNLSLAPHVSHHRQHPRSLSNSPTSLSHLIIFTSLSHHIIPPQLFHKNFVIYFTFQTKIS